MGDYISQSQDLLQMLKVERPACFGKVLLPDHLSPSKGQTRRVVRHVEQKEFNFRTLETLQKGNVLDGDADRTIYLKLLRENIDLYGVALIGYCLMSNHIHLIAIPHKVDGLAQALEQTHGRYASYWNAAHQSNGHVWQGRYYSCPLDQSHLWEALRYTELSPVRAGLVLGAELWPWSAAYRALLGG
jgi:REP element-mobilizing transposase RayT